MITQRFNVPTEWRIHSHYNFHYKGFLDMVNELPSYFQPHSLPVTMIEIGSYMGESTMMFASIGLFKTIHSIDPHQGTEEFNELFGYSWGDVEKEYKLNTRHFDNIIHHKDFSYNVVDKFEDNSIDFIYIDAEHTYESVKKDLELYLPKLKVGGVIGGHDYMSDFWPGVCRAVEEVVGTPTQLFQDSSWIKQIGCIETEDKIIESEPTEPTEPTKSTTLI